MTWLQRILILFLGVALSINSFLLPFEYFAFNNDFYVDHFIALDVHKSIGISQDSLTRVTNTLVQFIDDGTGDLKIKVPVNENLIQFFNDKEILHLEDIYHLTVSARHFLFYIQLGMIVLLIWLYFLSKSNLSVLLVLFKVAVITSLLSLMALMSLYFVDFDWAFRRFHEMFFTNDLWLLDPNTDRLIQLMPLEFFTTFTRYWLGTVFVTNIVFVFLYVLGKKTLQPVRIT